MSRFVVSAVGAAGACVAAVVWAVGLTIWQPLTEPAKPWHSVVAENNTYWARDLRYVALAAALVGMVVVFRGRWARFVLLGGLGWVGLDVWLDRIDVAGWFVAVAVSVLACAGLAGATYADRRLAGAPSRRVLIVTAAIAAALVQLAWSIVSNTDAHMERADVAYVRVALSVALGGLTFLCALTARPAITRARVAGAGLLTIAVSTGGYVMGEPVAAGVFGLVLFGGLTFLIGARRPAGVLDWIAYLAITGYAVGGYLFLGLVGAVVTAYFVPVAELLTWLAANPPVNDADFDILYVLSGLAAGAVFALPLSWVTRVRRVSTASVR